MVECPSICRCRSNIVWVRDGHGLVLVGQEDGRACTLDGVEAAIWEWLALGHCHEGIIRLLEALLGASSEEARCVLSGTLQNWHGAGLVDRVLEA